jgi:hypothetical protein
VVLGMPFDDPSWFFFATGAATPAICLTRPRAPSFRSARIAALRGSAAIFKTRSLRLGSVTGPGVDRTGIDSNRRSDNTDMRPTFRSLPGLNDDVSMMDASSLKYFKAMLFHRL